MTDIEMFKIASEQCGIKQNENEMLWALERVRLHMGQPLEYFLELGCHSGGSAVMWSQLLSDDGVLIGVTLSPNPNILCDRVRGITKKGFMLVNHPSELDSTRAEVVSLLSYRKLGGIFIDTLHKTEQTSVEFDLYRDLVGLPGIIAIHDICPQSRADGKEHTGVWWQKTKFSYNYEEKRDNTRPVCGIGVILL